MKEDNVDSILGSDASIVRTTVWRNEALNCFILVKTMFIKSYKIVTNDL